MSQKNRHCEARKARGGNLVLLALALFVSTAQASPRHYVYLFSLDDGQQTPTDNHTWATFLRVNDNGTIESNTINWLPISRIIRTLAMGPERGRNFPLAVAFDWAVQRNHPLSSWGPYETNAELYRLALIQKRLLESGDVWYRVLDSQNRIFKLLDPPAVPTPRAMMCIHAVSDVVQSVDQRGFLLTGATSGNAATERVAWHLAPWYIRNGAQPAPVESTLMARFEEELGLKKYKIEKRPLVEKKNLYCSTLEQCRELADSLSLP